MLSSGKEVAQISCNWNSEKNSKLNHGNSIYKETYSIGDSP